MSEWSVVEASVPRVSLRGGAFGKLIKNFVLCYFFISYLIRLFA
jgi:hypothetical protein